MRYHIPVLGKIDVLNARFVLCVLLKFRIGYLPDSARTEILSAKGSEMKCTACCIQNGACANYLTRNIVKYQPFTTNALYF